MIQAKFGLNWPSDFRGEDFWKSLQTDDGRQVMAIAHTGQNVPKFELYKHNDELFNIYYRIFYELWTFADYAN
jgi:hypothetical protein